MDTFQNIPPDETYPTQSMMGPNALMILRELLQARSLRQGCRVLDLGCGKGLSSVYLAKAYDAQVFAVDLWVTASENHRRFSRLGLDKQIIPLHADAASLPFADDYFDAVISIDAYHYFGGDDHYFDRHLRPLLKHGALAALALVGLKNELPGGIPQEMRPFWDEASFSTWHSAGWWAPRFIDKLSDLKVQEMACFDRAWAQWLATDDPHAVGDRAMMAADSGRYMNLVSVTGINRKPGR